MKKEHLKTVNVKSLSLKNCKKRFFSIISFALLLAFLNLTVGCKSYFRVNSHTNQDGLLSSKLIELRSQYKFFIVYLDGDAYWLNSLSISQDNTELRGKIETLPRQRYRFADAEPQRLHSYKSEERIALQEVHIYVHEYAKLDETNVIVPLSGIKRIDVFDRAQGATIASHIFGYAGVTLGVLVVLEIIIALLKSSCPFIYTYDGNHFVFTGEIFSGAIQPGLERKDFLSLPGIQPKDGEYLIKVANEIKEIQHINQLEMLVIDHPANSEVLVDKFGQPQSITEARAPVVAETFWGTDVLPLVESKDDYAYYFDNAATTDSSLDGLTLTFDKPEDATEAKLIVRARNSFWLEKVFDEFHGLFGRRYNAFDKREGSKKPAQMRKMMESQNLPLSVYVEKDGQWVFHDYYEVAGPMAMKDDILPISLQDLEGETIRVKLESGFLFWELDYVAMDFTTNIPLNINYISSTRAIDENGVDVSDAIKHDDHLYYVQPEIGNEATLSFPVPEFTNENRTLILHSKGYYKILRDQDGRPNWKKLQTFKKPGRMPQFSKELYHEWMKLSQKD